VSTRYQPRFRAFLDATGAAVEGAKVVDYIAWMSKQRRAYCAEYGLSERQFYRLLAQSGGQDQYTAWLKRSPSCATRPQ